MPASNDINLMPGSPQKTGPNIKDQIFQWVIKNGKRIVLLTQAIVLLVFISRFKFDTDVRNLSTEVEQNEAIVESLASTENRYINNQTKLGLVKPIVESQINWEERLTNFNKKIPDNLVLENVKFASNFINLTARTQSAESFQIFINLLVSDQTIKSAVLQSSQYDSKTREYRFVINMEIN